MHYSSSLRPALAKAGACLGLVAARSAYRYWPR